MELFSPLIQVQIGGYTFTRGVELHYCSSDETYFDWVKVRFVSPFEQNVSVTKNDPAAVLLGYNEQFEKVFEGYATCNFTSGETGNELLLKDGMILLETVRVNNTFMQTTPQEVIRYVANLAGVRTLVLDETPYQPIACLPILQRNGIQAIRELDAHWRLNQRFYFQNGALHWGKADEQTQLYCFAHAKNIIHFARADGFRELQTVSVPFIRHSQKIRVTHPQFTGDLTVRRVRTDTRGPGFIRTILYCKED